MTKQTHSPENSLGQKSSTANELQLSAAEIIYLSEEFDPSHSKQSAKITKILKKAGLFSYLQENPFLVQNKIISLIVQLETKKREAQNVDESH